MKEGGWTLAAIGVLAVIIGFAMDVTVDVGNIPGSSYLPGMPREVANFQKMHIQALVVQGGFALVICGTLLGAASAVISALREGRASEKPAAAAEYETDPAFKWIAGAVAAIILAVVLVAIIASPKTQPGANAVVDNVAIDAATAMDDMNIAVADAMAELNAANRALNDAMPR